MSTEEPEAEIPPLRGWRDYLRQGLSEAHKRRPASFYMLLAIPVVLLLGAKMTDPAISPERFAFTLVLVFLFLGVAIFRALMDVAEIGRNHLRERHASFRHTLGEASFMQALGARQDGEERK